MKMNIPDNNTDIVRCAQSIIDNYVSENLKKFKRGRVNTLDKILWMTAGALSVLTLSLYIIIR